MTGPEVGVGMVAVSPDGPAAARLLADGGAPAWMAGEAVTGTGQGRLVGTHSG